MFVVFGRDEVINKSRKSDKYLVYWVKSFSTIRSAGTKHSEASSTSYEGCNLMSW